MRIISLNLNGIRAAARKGVFEWLRRQRADVICMQETRAQRAQLTDSVFHPAGYHTFFFDAEKKGYSGVAVYSRAEPSRVVYGFGWPDMDTEGRYLQVDFGPLSVASIYIPSGTSGEVRQAVKFDLLERLKPFFLAARRQRRQFIFCGDWNIAHRKIDIKNWRPNQKNSGFLPAERAWLDWLYDEAGYVDVFRCVDPRAEQYSWWSNRGQAWANNVGWRLDLQVATPGIGACAQRADIYREQRFSDHAPVTIDYDYVL